MEAVAPLSDQAEQVAAPPPLTVVIVQRVDDAVPKYVPVT
jgi:hypothetical protein